MNAADRIAALRAGIRYFGIVFAAGFLLGAVRTLFLAPRLGEFRAVLLELPFILAVSWYVCGSTIRHYGLTPRMTPRVIMGVTAFTLLLVAELALSLLAFDRTLSGFVAELRTTHGLLGLAGQLVFGAMPVLLRHEEAR